MKNYILLITPIAGWLIAQAIKYAISLRKDGFSLGDLTSSGGFPSSHASFVMSLTTVVALLFGLKSAYFAICAVFSAVVLYDTIGVRRTTGEQTESINELSRKQHLKLEKFIHQSRGHDVVEMVSGAILGILIGTVAYYLL